MRIVFFDAAAPEGYSGLNDSIGGAESSLTRLANSLAHSDPVVVIVSRLPRGFARITGKTVWLGLGVRAIRALVRADVIVVQRRVAILLLARALNPTARLVIWYHDWIFVPHSNPAQLIIHRLKSFARSLVQLSTGSTAVVLSHAHLRNLQGGSCTPEPLRTRLQMRVIGNPVDRNAYPLPDGYDINKVIYFSAAWKGLGQVVATFQEVRRDIPELRLYVAHPQYDPPVDLVNAPGVHFLGNMSHSQLFAQVSSSLCVFYPANQIPETFGLVFAESHGVGTPVLAHPFGAAPEFLSEDELVDADDVEEIVTRLSKWRAPLGRPQVQPHTEFDIGQIRSRWIEVFEE